MIARFIMVRSPAGLRPPGFARFFLWTSANLSPIPPGEG
jgi:hypothetical protein